MRDALGTVMGVGDSVVWAQSHWGSRSITMHHCEVMGIGKARVTVRPYGKDGLHVGYPNRMVVTFATLPLTPR